MITDQEASLPIVWSFYDENGTNRFVLSIDGEGKTLTLRITRCEPLSLNVASWEARELREILDKWLPEIPQEAS